MSEEKMKPPITEVTEQMHRFYDCFSRDDLIRVAENHKLDFRDSCAEVAALKAELEQSERRVKWYDEVAKSYWSLSCRVNAENEQLKTEKMSSIEIRHNPDGTLDEVVGKGVDVHLESMSTDSASLIIEAGNRILNLSVDADVNRYEAPVLKVYVFSDDEGSTS